VADHALALGSAHQQIGGQGVGLPGQLGQQRAGRHPGVGDDAETVVDQAGEVDQPAPRRIQHAGLEFGRAAAHQLTQPLQRSEIGHMQQVEPGRGLPADQGGALGGVAGGRGEIGGGQDAAKRGHGAFLLSGRAGTARRLLEVGTPRPGKVPAETAANGGTYGHLPCLALRLQSEPPECGRHNVAPWGRGLRPALTHPPGNAGRPR